MPPVARKDEEEIITPDFSKIEVGCYLYIILLFYLLTYVATYVIIYM